MLCFFLSLLLLFVDWRTDNFFRRNYFAPLQAFQVATNIKRVDGNMREPIKIGCNTGGGKISIFNDAV